MKRAWLAWLLLTCLPCGAVAAQAVSTPSTAAIAQLEEAFDAGSLTSEELVRRLLARIDAYDNAGPRLNAVLFLNPRALEEARALDAERRQRGSRGPLHGIPVVLKDNIDAADMPTTAGSIVLEGSTPPDDAFVVKRLRAAGAIVLAKTNMSEFALGPDFSSMDGQMRNPHDPARAPAGSSGGTGVAVAAAYAPLGFGTDTGGSVRAPAFINGVVGLKPTWGLISRDGIVPLAQTLDTVGPMARNVSDVALALGLLTGVDAADPATRGSEGRFETDYLQYLDRDALKGARIGVARDFMGVHEETNRVVESALATMRERGATVIDVRFPGWLIPAIPEFYGTVVDAEFAAQLPAYLRTLAPDYPRTLEELVARTQGITAFRADGTGYNPERWESLKRQAESPSTDDHRYRAVRDYALPLVRAIVVGAMAAHELDVIVYPTMGRPARTIGGEEDEDAGDEGRGFVECITNLAGLPELVVPAGFTSRGLPVGLSFLGKAYGEPRLLALGYSFEQAVRAYRLPAHTPEMVDEGTK